ncbi:MAG: type II secretion system protein [Patescibacteria group bacterium]|nr:type II secretion system protein [Patescibacteria group bacterium]MDE2116669.1 type II secretion system protein [Patescibacteria group bacterium]
MRRERSKGFTLIELLVVISIIALLSGIVLASLNSARVRARDAKRKQDFEQIRNALALYYDQYGQYPPAKPQTSCGGTDVWASSNGTCGGQWLTTDPNFYQFMPSVPIDPTNTGTNAGWGDGNNVYSYYPSLANNQDYELVTQLENTSDKARCATTERYYHNGGVPWCAPWPSNMGRSGNIYTDH